jgi:hypothetical protein
MMRSVYCRVIRTVIAGFAALLVTRPAMAAYEVVSVTQGGAIGGVVTLVGKASA